MHVNSRLNPGGSGLRDGLHIRSRSPSSLVLCPSMDSSLVGGERLVQAGLEESVRNGSFAKIPFGENVGDCWNEIREISSGGKRILRKLRKYFLV